MHTRPVVCENKTCPPFEQVVDILSTDNYAAMVEEYCSIAREDPAYLTYHCTSVALRLQYELKLRDIPALTIGGCMSRYPKSCCLVDALEEAIALRAAQKQQQLNADECRSSEIQAGMNHQGQC